MKIITVPADVTVKLGSEGKVIPFKEALLLHLDSYVEIKTISQVRDASKVAEAIEKGNGTISLEDKQYEILAAACKAKVYHTTITRQLLIYYAAIDSASNG